MEDNIIIYFINEDDNLKYFKSLSLLLPALKNIHINNFVLYKIQYIAVKIDLRNNDYKSGDIMYLLRNILKFQFHIFNKPMTNKAIKELHK